MIFAMAMALGCSGSEPLDRTDSAVAGVGADVPTWHQDVAPIVARSCDGCHQAGVAGAVTWKSDAEIQAWAPSMAAEVAAMLGAHA